MNTLKYLSSAKILAAIFCIFLLCSSQLDGKEPENDIEPPRVIVWVKFEKIEKDAAFIGTERYTLPQIRSLIKMMEVQFEVGVHYKQQGETWAEATKKIDQLANDVGASRTHLVSKPKPIPQ